jgi:hypothetical protein
MKEGKIMREIFLVELVKEVLGPREGIRETLLDSPLNEYITGVLAPVILDIDQITPDIDNEAEMPIEDLSAYDEEQDTDRNIGVPPLFSPVLDPKSRSPTMGLSFVIESLGVPKVDVCLTWARYKFSIDQGIAR